MNTKHLPTAQTHPSTSMSWLSSKVSAMVVKSTISVKKIWVARVGYKVSKTPRAKNL